MAMMNKLFGWVQIAWCAEGSGGGPKIGQKGSKSWDHVTFQRDSKMTQLEGKCVGEWESQAARGPERLGSQMGGPNRMPSGCTKHWE